MVMDVVKLAEDGTLGKPVGEEPKAEPAEGEARVEPWWSGQTNLRRQSQVRLRPRQSQWDEDRG